MRSFEIEDVGDIPLPDQMPSPISVPRELKERASGTFESLMTQNQDLMNRLSTSLRRNLDFENQVAELFDRRNYLELQARTLHSEMSAISERNRTLEREFLSLREQRDSAERIYAELEEQTSTKILSLSSEVGRLKRFHRRIQTYVRPLIRQLKLDFSAERVKFEKTFSENFELREKINHLRLQLSETIQRLQAQHTENEKAQRTLIDGYESKLQEMFIELQAKRSEGKILAEKNEDLSFRQQHMTETQALLENRAIVVERKLAELRSNTDITIAELQNQNITLKSETQKLYVEKSSFEQSVQDLGATLTETQKELDALRERYNGLQLVWEEAASKLESQQDQNANLQKLNRELSRSLNEKRRENEVLMEKLTKVEEQSQKKLDSVFENIKGLKGESMTINEDQSTQNESWKRVESLLNDFEIRP